MFIILFKINLNNIGFLTWDIDSENADTYKHLCICSTSDTPEKNTLCLCATVTTVDIRLVTHEGEYVAKIERERNTQVRTSLHGTMENYGGVRTVTDLGQSVIDRDCSFLVEHYTYRYNKYLIPTNMIRGMYVVWTKYIRTINYSEKYYSINELRIFQIYDYWLGIVMSYLMEGFEWLKSHKYIHKHNCVWIK